VKKPVSKFAFQVHNLQRYTAAHEAARSKAATEEELALARAQVKRMGALWEELTNARRELDETRHQPRDRRPPKVGRCTLNQADP
jgi:hypothetical protein